MTTTVKPASHRPASLAKTPPAPVPADVSAKGLLFLMREEGCILHPYNDPVGYATIGVGHLIGRRPVNDADRRKFAGFTQQDAAELLRADVKKFVDHVKARAAAGKWHLTQPQFDALVSLCFNCGGGAIDGNIGKALDRSDYRAAASVILQWCNAGGKPILLPRRRREVEIFLHGNYPS